MDLGMGELVVIFLVVMILFGANKLPGLGEGLGKALRGFKDAMREAPSPPPPAEEKELPPAAPGPSAGATPSPDRTARS